MKQFAMTIVQATSTGILEVFVDKIHGHQQRLIIPNSAFLIPYSLFLGKPLIHPRIETNYINRGFLDRN